MWNSIRNAAEKYAVKQGEAGLRGVLLLAGFACATWSALAFPEFWLAAPAKDITSRILVGDRFGAGTLTSTSRSGWANARPLVERYDLARAASLVSFRIEEELMGGKSFEEANQGWNFAYHKLTTALLLNPNDSFLWFLRYSAEISRNGFDVSTLRYLTQSYMSGPLEGWISLRRNRLALATFPNLSEPMKARTISEFAGMVESDFTEEAASNLTGVGWGQKDELLSSLSGVDVIPREKFAKLLGREGIMIPVPGIQIDERLWRQ